MSGEWTMYRAPTEMRKTAVCSFCTPVSVQREMNNLAIIYRLAEDPSVKRYYLILHVYTWSLW